MNINKLLKLNMVRPINQRLSLSDVQKQIESGKAYAAKMAIRALIEKEVAPIAIANRKAWAFTSGCNRTENQGYTMDLTKYRETFAIGQRVQIDTMEDLGAVNAPCNGITDRQRETAIETEETT